MELKEIIRGLVRESIKESISEMSQNDVHFKNIMRLYDHGGSFTKKKVAVAVCKNPNASRAKIVDYLMDTDYNEIIDIQDELNIHEALVKEAQGRIPKLFLKIEAVKKEIDKLTAERKAKFGGEYARKLNAETDPKKRENLKEPILAISKKITALQKNLLDLYDMEEKYIQNLDKDAELELESVNEVSYNVKADNAYQFINGAVAVLSMYVKDEKLENNVKQTLQKIIKDLEGLRKYFFSRKDESIVNEAKFEVYHDSYTSAINAAKEWAEKQGYTINDDDAFTKIGMGPRKPSEGKTNKFSIELSKDGKVQRKQLHIQVYGMRTKYELNCYIG